MDVEDGLKPGTTSASNAELREAKKRTRLRGGRRTRSWLWGGVSGAGGPARTMMYLLVSELTADGIPVTTPSLATGSWPMRPGMPGCRHMPG